MTAWEDVSTREAISNDKIRMMTGSGWLTEDANEGDEYSGSEEHDGDVELVCWLDDWLDGSAKFAYCRLVLSSMTCPDSVF